MDIDEAFREVLGKLAEEAQERGKLLMERSSTHIEVELRTRERDDLAAEIGRLRAQAQRNADQVKKQESACTIFFDAVQNLLQAVDSAGFQEDAPARQRAAIVKEAAKSAGEFCGEIPF